jgi:glyoxylase I family protein
MLKITRVHHIAIIASNYEKSRHFYTQVLGLQVIREVYREARDSYKLDLAIGNHYVIELFSFPNPPARPSRPESCGLRHLAFEVEDVAQAKQNLEAKGIEVEDIRIDEFTGKKFTFFADPDDLPIEFYEQ